MHKTKEISKESVCLISGKEDILRSKNAFGVNRVKKKRRASFLSVFIKNLGDPVIRILLFALALNIFFMIRGKDWKEGAGIAVSVLLATLISSISEYKRDTAYEKLSVTVTENYKVLREGAYMHVPSEELVCGDIVFLSAGERIPADCILLEGSLRTNQAPLTGESEEIEKKSNEKSSSHLLSLFKAFFCGEENKEKISSLASSLTPESENALFCGCFVNFGRGCTLVFSVGENTRFGKISDSLMGEEEKTPLRERLDKLAKQISVIGYCASALIAFAYLFNSFVIESGFSLPLILAKLSNMSFLFSSLISAFTLALTVIVMAVPEGLPMMIAVVLSRNASRMAKEGVLVRHAQGIEAAGCMNILFTDKTGTLTEGNPSISSIIAYGRDFSSRKEFAKFSPLAEELLALNAVYNTSSVFSSDGSVISGNTAEKVLLAFSSSKQRRFDCKLISHSPFDSIKKQSSAEVIYNGKKCTLIKGAPEIIIKKASLILSDDGRMLPLDKYELEKRISHHSSLGERIIITAFCEEGAELCIICALAMSDRLRKQAKGTVESLRRAGIRTVMITGDGKQTAERIASDCKILTRLQGLSLSGSDIDKLSDKELCECLSRLAVVYRALPEHKLRLVKAAKSLSLVCGMTGDGLNDAPALKNADCGFSLGCGSEVSKEASDIIILDNNLSSVLNAVRYGRNIFMNIRKFITLQLIMNFTATAISMIGPFIGIEAPVTVVQMLWINIVMDTLGGLAFAGEQADERILLEKPKRRDEPVLNMGTVKKVARLSLFSTAMCVFFLKSRLIHILFNCNEASTYHLTAFFAFFIFTGALNCFNARTERLNKLSGISRNPTFIFIISLVALLQVAFVYFGSTLMRTVPLSAFHLFLTVLFALPILIFEFFCGVWERLGTVHSA